MNRDEALLLAEKCHPAAIGVDTVRDWRELRGLDYSLDEEYTHPTVYAVNRHNRVIIKRVEVDGKLSNFRAGLQCD